jgi:hypothetical protein
MNAMKRRGLTRFWLEWGRIGDASNFTESKFESVSDFFGEWGSSGFRGVYRFILDVRGMLGVMGWPNLNANSFLVSSGDLKLGISDKGIECVIPPDEEPGVIDEFEG